MALLCTVLTFVVWHYSSPLHTAELTRIGELNSAQNLSLLSQVIHLEINEQTIQGLGPKATPLGVPRDLHAELIHLLDGAGAKVCVLDLVFRFSYPKEDRAVWDAIRAASGLHVVLPLLKSDEEGQDIHEPDSTVFALGPLPNLHPATARVRVGEGRFFGFEPWQYDPGRKRRIPYLALAAASAFLGQSSRLEPADHALGRLEWRPSVERFVVPNPSALIAPVETIEYLRAMEILRDPTRRENFRGKMVVVGRADDTITTIAGDTTGPLFVGRMAAVLLAGDLDLQPPRPLETWIIVFALAWLGAWAILTRHPWQSALVAGVVMGIAVALPRTALLDWRIPVFQIAPAVAVTLACAGALALRVAADREYLPYFARSGTLPTGLRLGTYVFVDIVGSTTLAGKLGAAETGAVFQSTLEKLARAVESESGVVERFLGDGLLAAFYGQDRAERVLSFIRTVWAEEWIIEGQAIRLSLGAEDGEATGSLLRSRTLVDWSSFGHTIHVAARLQAACGAADVDHLIGPELAKDIQNQANLVPVSLTNLKGVGDLEAFTLESST